MSIPAKPETEAPKPASVAMPDNFTLRVRTQRGMGTVISVRPDKKRPFLVRLDQDGKNPFWALIDNMQPVGFARSITFTAPDKA